MKQDLEKKLKSFIQNRFEYNLKDSSFTSFYDIEGDGRTVRVGITYNRKNLKIKNSEKRSEWIDIAQDLISSLKKELNLNFSLFNFFERECEEWVVLKIKEQ